MTKDGPLYPFPPLLWANRESSLKSNLTQSVSGRDVLENSAMSQTVLPLAASSSSFPPCCTTAGTTGMTSVDPDSVSVGAGLRVHCTGVPPRCLLGGFFFFSVMYISLWFLYQIICFVSFLTPFGRKRRILQKGFLSIHKYECNFSPEVDEEHKRKHYGRWNRICFLTWKKKNNM